MCIRDSASTMVVVNGQQPSLPPTNNNNNRYSAAALKHHHQYNAALDIELLQESLDAMNVIEGLARYVSVEKWRLDAKEEGGVGGGDGMGP